MRAYFCCFLFALCSFCAWAQDSSSLSEEGVRSWKAAVALLDMAKSADELEGPIKEFKKVIISDPNYADTYFNLGKLYTRYGKEKGLKYLDKARDYYASYIKLRPDDRKAAEDELYLLGVVRENTINNLPPKDKAEHFFPLFEGTWEGSGIKISITGLQTDDSSSIWGIGSCRIYNYYGHGVNSSIWDSYTDAVKDHWTDKRTNNAHLSKDGDKITWDGSIYYNSRASSNRTTITDYLVGKYWGEYDTYLLKFYTATINNNALSIKCESIYYDLVFDSQGYGHTNKKRKTDVKYYTLYRNQ